ncbi:MAG: GxxExxY protein [Planctomycetes bacterium]|nr:GxxExxY protein [Planctomycetota bacterium]
MAEELIYKDLAFKIRKCLMNVYNKLGPGFREETYKKALMKEFVNDNIPFSQEKPIPIKYDGDIIDEYRVDLVAFDKIILELKAVTEMHPMFEAQLLSYLKAANIKLGLLVNFRTDKLFIKRLVNPRLKESD